MIDKVCRAGPAWPALDSEKLFLMTGLRSLGAAALLLGLACGQGPLNGVIDIHAHCDPDSTARSIDAMLKLKR